MARLNSRRLPLPFLCLGILCPWMLGAGGCTDDIDAVRDIQSKRQHRVQSLSHQDHLGDTFDLLSRLVELNPKESRRQITYHLNQWRQERRVDSSPAKITPLLKTVDDLLGDDGLNQRVKRDSFLASDVNHLRDSYLCRQVVQWVDHPQQDDPLLANWFDSLDDRIGEEAVAELQTASRLFDWIVRNIAYEPMLPKTPAPPSPPMSSGLQFRFPGYRQTDYQTLWRGTGDAWQQAGLFILLARQASIPAFVLSLPHEKTGELLPWCVGVLAGDQIYLFEPTLGIPIPGPQQVGIATLAEARRDASVLRRLKVPGFFEYPVSKADIGQCVALLHVVPEAVSPRMKLLESGLTGDRRMGVYVDADSIAAKVDAVRGIAGVRLWPKALQSEIYAEDLLRAETRDPLFQFWYRSRWAILESAMPSSELLSQGRWRHLHGDFDTNEDETLKGARPLYLSQRSPEFEIADLQIDVNLQIAYGIRRELGTTSEMYQRQVHQAQGMMRMGKQTATYWISLIQYDDEQFDTAETWFTKRVIDDGQASRWDAPANYNLARTLERLGQRSKAIERYKSDQNPRPHGSRIRARLLAKQSTEN